MTTSGSQAQNRAEEDDYDDSGVSTMASDSQSSSIPSTTTTTSTTFLSFASDTQSIPLSQLSASVGTSETFSNSLSPSSTGIQGSSVDVAMDWIPSQPQDQQPLANQPPATAQIQIVVSQPPEQETLLQTPGAPPLAKTPPGPHPIPLDVASAVALPALVPEDMSLETLYARVKTLFPTFKPHCILRFSSLLGLGKPSSLPKVWKGARKPKQRKGEGETRELRLELDIKPAPDTSFLDDEVGMIYGASEHCFVLGVVLCMRNVCVLCWAVHTVFVTILISRCCWMRMHVYILYLYCIIMCMWRD